jgi:hypothetical protein
VRFVRHLVASSLVIAFICAVAVFAGLGGQPGKPAIFCPHGCTPQSLGLTPGDPALRHLAAPASGHQPPGPDYANLAQTVVLGTAVAMLVVAVDVTARRRRRARRTRST